MASDEPLAPIDIVNKVLVSDPAILGVVAADDEGNKLASAMKGEMPDKEELTDPFFEKRAKLLALMKSMATQNEGLLGRFQSIVLNFERAKVVILSLPEFRINLGLRLVRSANVDYLTLSLLALLGIVGRTERNQRATGEEPRPKKTESPRAITSNFNDSVRTRE